MDANILQQLVRDRAEKRAVALATRLTDGIQKLVYPSDTQEEKWLIEAASQVLASDRGAIVEGPGGEWFLNPFNPPLRLILVGAVHIAQPLSQMGRIAGYDVTVVDPRTSFASPERFPEMRLLTSWPDEAMAALAPDARTAIVTLTHDPKLDDPALQAALRSPAFYIGALGSKKTHASRVARLSDAGFSQDEIARIHGPVGLAIGARSPAEIAISIMAEITETLRK
ncbi:XdhC family protein [Parvibaculum sp.]|jgi:xanthine dehydrogenase accessory factor|uniref:XdhC family protein n=1 Tax=Parvibaculum sp. TaxID=2024848 RepID=UPI000C3D72B0|nr:XdhC family protein [Parvibaculum sp.]HAC57470.1 xanthine dehydrogenase [Rhodobiaceae bacterium]MAU60456.1 xanthine dehydrogenase [Parvibaculum sp.]MBO6669175.1 XdhC family protein [Parvibaculum sp.]MBO6692470.1 XdhC family protein [Parvibaculum sp.]MBO6713059.1 XdhC family protein [Parvibaculum sp.]|tara:strand:+ start:498 stop:1175 length:678 start_codon:yes stop_codon:yes gene_type:complete